MDSRASSLMTEAMSWQDFIASKFLRDRASSGEGIPECDDPEMLVALPSDCVPSELVEGTTLRIDELEEDIRPIWRRRETARSQDRNKKGSREQLQHTPSTPPGHGQAPQARDAQAERPPCNISQKTKSFAKILFDFATFDQEAARRKERSCHVTKSTETI
ncbi:hypothetical protein BHE74_00048290 [Ensete ventricosum]|nr:hypothetical protein BHE74_00048290 [Ensete ventricosum]